MAPCPRASNSLASCSENSLPESQTLSSQAPALFFWLIVSCLLSYFQFIWPLPRTWLDFRRVPSARSISPQVRVSNFLPAYNLQKVSHCAGCRSDWAYRQLLLHLCMAPCTKLSSCKLHKIRIHHDLVCRCLWNLKSMVRNRFSLDGYHERRTLFYQSSLSSRARMLLHRLLPQTRCSSFVDHPVKDGTETWPFSSDFFPTIICQYNSKTPTLRKQSAHAWKFLCENHATLYVCPPTASSELTCCLPWVKANFVTFVSHTSSWKVKSCWCFTAVHTCRPSIHLVLVMTWGILDWFHRAAWRHVFFKAAARLFSRL